MAARTVSATLSAAQIKALSTDINDDENGIDRWFSNWVQVRANHLMDTIFQQEIARLISEGKTISGSKDDIILAAPIKSASERDKETLSRQREIGSTAVNGSAFGSGSAFSAELPGNPT
jgi:hypothetical protein